MAGVKEALGSFTYVRRLETNISPIDKQTNTMQINNE